MWEHKAILQKAYGKAIESVWMESHLTRTEVDILLFLANNKQFDTATDIVEKRGISKSHVSESIKSLEEKGYLTRTYRENNRRTIHLSLCEKADEVISRGRQAQIHFVQSSMKDFSEEEKKQMKNFFDRMAENMKKYMEQE